MTSPLKPWEMRPDANQRIERDTSRPSVRLRIPRDATKSNEDMNQRASPPPIPSRQRNTENRSIAQPYGSSYYNSYGMYGSGYNGMQITFNHLYFDWESL